MAKYVITPGENIPYVLKDGDVCVIFGKIYPFLGYFQNIKDAYKLNKIGVVYIRVTNQYKLICDRTDIESTNNYNQAIRKKIENDKTIVPKREIGNKEIFYVPISQNDGYLKVLIKQILYELQIDLREYRDKFKDDNHMNNMKRLIVSDASLTYEKFCEWLSILGYSHNIEIINPEGKLFVAPESSNLIY